MSDQMIPQPIDPADVRKGDRVRVTVEGTVSRPKDADGFILILTPDRLRMHCRPHSVHLIERADPVAELIERTARAMHESDIASFVDWDALSEDTRMHYRARAAMRELNQRKGNVS